LWIFYPNYYDLAKLKDKKTTTLYDCVDYQEDQKKESLLIDHVDYFFVNSLSLQKLHKQKNKKAIYINSQGFFKPDDKKIKNINLEINKPIIGYVGGINYRLNYPLLNQLIKNHQEWQFVFYGPEQENKEKDKIYETKKWIRKLKKYKNTTFDYKEDRYYIYGLIKNFDIAIIPYNPKLSFNKYCYPMKVFEYLYMGKHVISSDILELKTQKFKSSIKVLKSYEKWEKLMVCLLKNKLSKNQVSKQSEMAIKNSWRNKINKISKHI
jgi:hypothetical protein